MVVQKILAGRCNKRRRLIECEAANRWSIPIMKGTSAPQTYQVGRDMRRLVQEIPSEPLIEKNRPTAVKKQKPSNSFVPNCRHADLPWVFIISQNQSSISKGDSVASQSKDPVSFNSLVGRFASFRLTSQEVR